MTSILVVEDDLEAQALVEISLRGCDLHFADSLAKARHDFASTPTFDLVLLDLDLPDGNGLALCAELWTANRRRVPVIFLTASDDARDVVAAFSLGADDYVRKPYAPLELRARVESRLRSHRETLCESTVETIGGLHIDTEKMRVYCESEAGRIELALTATEYRLLAALHEKPGRLMTRDNLIFAAWNGSVVGPRTVDTHICNLRLKLGSARVALEAVRGLGYRLTESPIQHVE